MHLYLGIATCKGKLLGVLYCDAVDYLDMVEGNKETSE